MSPVARVLLGSLILVMSNVASTTFAAGMPPEQLFRNARFDSSIPRQKELLGFDPGARPLHHAELMRYLEALADSSPQAKLIPYAESHEGRKLAYLAISDASTIARLDEFRREHMNRVDPRSNNKSDDGWADKTRAVAWIAYGIHGDELSSVDAAAAMAYRLVAGEDPLAKRLRKELVILIDPIENPDGRERFLAQTTSFAHAIPSADSEDLSHTTVWPWGRGNHYLFDLNRDWFSMVHPESRRSEVIASWDPQLMVDSHEMGGDASYLFSPPRHPFNPHLPPSHSRWNDEFAADQARGLDDRGYAYYTREWNEEFFPGYGSSWASYRGAVGILYEMSSTEGTLVRQRAGTTRTYAQAVEHQVTSSVANLTTLVEHRREILLDFVADRQKAMAEGEIGAWVLPRGRHAERTDALAGLLQAQGIDVLLSITSPPRVGGLRDIYTGTEVNAKGLPESWLIPMNQPASRLARTLLDPHVPMPGSFLREQREYLETGKGSRLYETSAWSLILSYGIDAYWTSQRPTEGWANLDPIPPRFGIEDTSEKFGYVFDGNSDRAAAAVGDLLQRELAVRVAEKPFTIGGASFDQGAFLVKREGNPDDLAAQLREVAEDRKLRIQAIATAKAERGPDLGGSHFKPLVTPRIGVWSGNPISAPAYGALWCLFDLEMRMRFSGLDIARFPSTALDRYNVLIFPPVRGSADQYAAILGEAGLERLTRWIEGGGTAIGIGGGAEFLADVDTDLTRTRLRRQALERFPTAVIGITADEATQAGPFRAVGVRAPKKKKSDEEIDAPTPRRDSPYDVAPIIGPGAAPFTRGVELGTPVSMEPVALARWIEPWLSPGKEKPELADLERADARLRLFSPQGSFLRVELDPNVWLTWGLSAELPALVRSSDTLVAGPPAQVAARFAGVDRLHLGGLLWPEAAGRLANTAYAVRESKGRGQIILFLNEPEFRGWTLGTRRLLQNAILFGPGLGTRWSTPW